MKKSKSTKNRKVSTQRPQRRGQQSPVIQSRSISKLRQLLLCVRAGGRCEFDGCNDYLFEHPLTLKEGNFSEAAHIVAFRENGPRGLDGVRPADINNVKNLMLLCPFCHKLIDDNPTDYTRESLEAFKRSHEVRIKYLTGLGADRKTSVIVFKAKIGGHTVAVPFDQIVEATAPRYPATRDPLKIDLTEIPTTGEAFNQTACDTIRQRVAETFRPEGEATKFGHVSVFAIGPMALLAFLGRQLTNKVPVDLYQRHRDTETWTWKADGPAVTYRIDEVRDGDPKKVAVVLSLSGKLDLGRLPEETRHSYSVYEITLDGVVPATTFLRTRRDLEGFRLAYQELLATIAARHGHLEEIDMFPAVPAPIAVLLGREPLPRVHPRLRFFDQDLETGWIFQFTV
jgi:CBASS immunity sensor of nucleotide second messenger signals/HNH endonuclease